MLKVDQKGAFFRQYLPFASRTGPLKIVVIGGSGGIGTALLHEIRSCYPRAELYATRHSTESADVRLCGNIRWSNLDITSEEHICDFAEQFDVVDWLISAAGLLHDQGRLPEKSLRQIDPEFFLRNLQINALSALLLAKHFTSALQQSESPRMAVISAKVGSIGDNRLGGWHSYRCSKAALNMALKNISIEWQRSMPDMCVAALHPGTTDTELSMPFQRSVPKEKLFTPEYTARCLVEVISGLRASDSGKFLAYDGTELPW